MDNNINDLSSVSVSSNNVPPPTPPVIPSQPRFRINKLFLMVGVVIFIMIIGSGGFLLGMKAIKESKPITASPTIGQKACTQEAKICPDGSSVGRTGLNCDFAPCSTVSNLLSLSPSPNISTLSASPSNISQLSVENLHWKNYTCKYDGYSVSIPDEVGVSMFDGWGGDPECPRDINGGMTVYTHPEDLLKMSENQIKEIKDVRIDGVDGKYVKVEQIDSGKVSRHLLMYQFKRVEYIYLILDLDYKDPIQELDFYKDTNWGAMLDEYNKAQNNSPSQINIVSVFNQIASTLKFIPALPRPTRDSKLPVICLASNTLISTPNGEINVTEISPGMEVWSTNRKGQRIAVPVIKTVSTLAPESHKVVHLVLNDGRQVWISPNHPTIGNQTVGEFKVGDIYEHSIVINTELVSYWDDKTYDILPNSDTGNYWANGILMGSTLK